ncbi:MAG: LrgB family protein [Alphaproteobacteria bacterium]
MLLDIAHHPLMALFVTIGSYLVAQRVQAKMNGNSALNPVVMAIFMVVIYLVVCDIPYNTYLTNATLINSLLGPATVALALPLYKQLDVIKRSALAIMSAVCVSAIVAAGLAYVLADMMGANEAIKLSIMPKSVTTPIAIGIAEKIGTEASLAVFFLFTTGIVGTLIVSALFKLFRVTDQRAIGLSLGVTCHGLGVARAFQYSEKAGVFAALGMSVMGVLCGIAIPIVVLMFLQ